MYMLTLSADSEGVFCWFYRIIGLFINLKLVWATNIRAGNEKNTFNGNRIFFDCIIYVADRLCEGNVDQGN